MSLKNVGLYFLLSISLCLSGCAFGQKTDYSGRSDFNIKPQSHKIIVAVHDLRPYVQDNTSPADYTGSLRSLYGIPYNIKTTSGKPLSDDLGMMIVNTMNDKNVSSTQQIIPYLSSFEDVKKKFSENGKGSRLYYIKMLEWKTDTYMNVGFFFDLQLQVYDDQLNEVGSNVQKGTFTFDKKQPGKEDLSSATTDILGKLFDIKENNPATIASLPVKALENDTVKPKSQEIVIAKEDPLFKSVPPEVKNDIKIKCGKDFPKDFAMQADCASKQTEGWMKLNK